VCVCVCACVRACVRACVCVCTLVPADFADGGRISESSGGRDGTDP